MLRDPAHELYDSACELLIAAQRLRSAARHPHCGQAVPATLGCLGAALDELATATATLEGLHDLTAALMAARDACEAARSQAAAGQVAVRAFS